jgi:hypothetical protein
MDPIQRMEIQNQEHAAWVNACKKLRAIGLDVNTVDVITFEPARLALCEWALAYAAGFALDVFTMPDG